MIDICMSEFLEELEDESCWVPVKTQPDLESWRQVAKGGLPYVCLKARARFSALPSAIFKLIWDAKLRPTWDSFAQAQPRDGRPFDPEAPALQSDTRWRDEVKETSEVKKDITELILKQHRIEGAPHSLLNHLGMICPLVRTDSG